MLTAEGPADPPVPARSTPASGSWAFRTLTAFPSHLPASRLWKLPWTRAIEPVAFCAVALAVAARHGAVAGVAAGAVAIVLTGLAVRRADWALGLLVVAYAAAPRIDAELRAEDFVTLGLVLAAMRKRRPVETPLDGPLSLWVLAIGLALAVGLIQGTVARPAVAAFTALKLVEYVIAFYAAFLLRTRIDGAFVLALAILGIAGTIDALAGAARPFDRWPYKAESNHVGGFAVLCAGLAYARLAEGRGARWWIVLLLAAAVTALAGSRIALLALAFVSLLQFRVRGARGPAAVVLALGALALAGPLRRRAEDAPAEWRTFVRTETRVSEGLPPVFSYTRNRFEVWALLEEDVAKYPLAGTGPGSRDRVVYENAYVMLACEEGALGLAAFGLAVVSLLLLLRRAGDRAATNATAAMLVLGLTSISFFLAREAGPWWIMAGSALGGYTRPDGGT
ncbi:MAG: hypothetical protein HYY17_00295 [Planctomycetes bacterium]|nr:hypothetical protein [Planctomycetota bacterium]